MIKESVTPAEMVDYLNQILRTDRDAISKLFLTRTPCNMFLANHPTVQVGKVGEGENVQTPGPQAYDVGPLGILNGAFGVFDSGKKKGWGPLTMEIDELNIIHKFELTENPPE